METKERLAKIEADLLRNESDEQRLSRLTAVKEYQELFLAAPDLLNACRKLAAWYKSDPKSPVDLMAAADAAIHAVAKAEGEA